MAKIVVSFRLSCVDLINLLVKENGGRKEGGREGGWKDDCKGLR